MAAKVVGGGSGVLKNYQPKYVSNHRKLPKSPETTLTFSLAMEVFFGVVVSSIFF